MRTTYTLYKSTNPKKKFDIYVIHKGRIRKVSFGARGYSDYTIHKDYSRMKRYRKRHRRDKIRDQSKSGFWSWWVLWNKPSLRQSLKDTRKRFKMKPTRF